MKRFAALALFAVASCAHAPRLPDLNGSEQQQVCRGGPPPGISFTPPKDALNEGSLMIAWHPDVRWIKPDYGQTRFEITVDKQGKLQTVHSLDYSGILKSRWAEAAAEHHFRARRFFAGTLDTSVRLAGTYSHTTDEIQLSGCASSDKESSLAPRATNISGSGAWTFSR